MPTFLAAAVQMATDANLRTNLERARVLVQRAVDRGAVLVVLPEVFAWRGSREEESAIASAVPGPVSDFLCGLATELRIVLVGGSFLESVADTTRTYNTSLLVDADGVIRGTYRKMHLFDIDLPGQVTVRESDGRAAGDEVVAVTTALGRIGLTICYDLRFPELYRRLTALGCTIFTVPSAFTFHTGAAHWEPLLRARAIENQCYVIAPNQAGKSPHGYADYGNSMIVDPWGTVLARASGGEQVITAEIDTEHLARLRREMPCQSHVRLRA